MVYGDAGVYGGNLVSRVVTGYAARWDITLSSPTEVTVGCVTLPIKTWATEKVPWKQHYVTAAEKREIRGWIKLFCTPAKIKATFDRTKSRRKK